MKIRELFERDVTRDIPPVVYFHEQSPERLASEVGEYIITGGYPAGDPRARRLPEGQGIHEQFVHLLQAIKAEIDKSGGPELPASWISGFYGSGKSSFAKLLGLALDGRRLPDGTMLYESLLRRDDSPRGREFHDAWHALYDAIEPMAVVFDIGGVAREDEHIHSAVVRQLQRRLDYCATSNLVAEHELKLELDGEWSEFQKAARKTLGKPWSEAKDSQQADDYFSQVMHAMHPDRYVDPMSWIDSRAGQRTGAGTSVVEVANTIANMRRFRAPDKTIFLVVDEVSQYIAQQEPRMLALQSFVSELGQRLRGAVWLLATGQQKLDNEASAATVVGKLKDRFPDRLRVHLFPNNIRDVVHRRLLKKQKDKEGILRGLFQKHRSDLKRFGYGAADIGEEEFVDVYPMLPGHISLLLDITTALRTRSTRIQGDDHAIRGLLQLLGELFRAQRLAERDVGDLVTLDAIFEVQESALDADIQTSLGRIFEHLGSRDSLPARAAKAVALLELIQEKTPTTTDLVASCLYDRLGRESQIEAVTEALEALRGANLVGYSEKLGYKVQSSAGQEWQRERSDIVVPPEEVSELIRENLERLIAEPERPKLKGRPFPWGAFYSDSRKANDLRVKNPHDDAAVTVDFRYVGADERKSAEWVKKSADGPLADRLLWVVGDPGQVDYLAKELGKSRRMDKRYDSRSESLTREKQRLLFEEKARIEDLEGRLKDAVAAAFHDGTLYFRGRAVAPRDLGGAFSTALSVIGNRILPELYPHFTEIAVTSAELKQLLEPTLSGPSSKFIDGLGILALDAGKYVPTCSGPVPARILQAVETQGGMTGQILLSTFARPPYGYPADVVKACLAGLLRGGKIRIRPESGKEITSIRDEGVRDLFRLERDLGRSAIVPGGDTTVGPRDRAAICKFFKDSLSVELDRDNDTIADAVYQHLVPRRKDLRDVEARLSRLPGRPQATPALVRLGQALDECGRSRQVEPTVAAVRDQIDALRDGFEQIGIYKTEITDDAIAGVTEAARVRDAELAQLEAFEDDFATIRDSAELVRSHLASERPWRDIGSLTPALRKIREAYVATRRTLVSQHERQAEAARAAIKSRPGFERLNADGAHHVLRPITEALFDTTAETVSPPLADLRDRFPRRLEKAVQEANDRLDAKLAADEKKPTPVVKVAANLSGREITTREQLKALLSELEGRIGPHLDKGARVRIV